ncbi:MAG: hypothetical protein LBL94_02635 [Prevotellaceae bacterium]|jgi:hypothetical protein|nr:hypothetical protein [Prevotellaceae bacterium]
MERHGSGGIAGKGGGVVYDYVLLHLFIDKKANILIHGGKCMDEFLIIQQVKQLKKIYFLSVLQSRSTR